MAPQGVERAELIGFRNYPDEAEPTTKKTNEIWKIPERWQKARQYLNYHHVLRTDVDVLSPHP